jgi:cyclopropane fatty-acyl-phospholipid synthase-like methyltransferase
MNLFKKIFFNLLYLGNPPWDTGVSPPELKQFLEENPPGRALDLGCGTGTNVITLANHGWQATGVDFVGRAIREARRKARQAGVQAHFLVEDVTRLKGVEGQFDLILDMGCFHNLADESIQAYCANLKRLLADGGTYLMYGFFSPEDGSTGLKAAHLACLDDWLQLVERRDGTERGKRPSAWFTYRKS